jgi:hypothetical protein
MDAIVRLLQAAHQSTPQAALRQPERSADDAIWNTLISGHPNRYEDMPQVFSVAQGLAVKLQAFKALPAPAMPYAPVVLAGLLNFLWRSQNVFALPPDMANGQAGTVKVAVAALARDWAPPAKQPWFPLLAGFSISVDTVLKKLQACTWEEVYKHLDPEMDKLKALAQQILASIKQSHPAAHPAAMAWLMGTIVQKNVFSPLDGSVPESYSERLTRIYEDLERSAEAAFFPWLAEGFRAVREKPLDELSRWQGGIPPKTPAKKGKASKARRPR